MSDTDQHIRNALEYLDPKSQLYNIGKARSEIRDALSHYSIEQEVKGENNDTRERRLQQDSGSRE